MKSVVVYSASYCPYCVRAKDLLKRQGIPFQEIDVTDLETRGEMLSRSGGRKTIPQIFIGDIHVGGFDDLFTIYQAGELEKILKD